MRSKEDPSLCVHADPPEQAFRPWNNYLQSCAMPDIKKWSFTDNLLKTEPAGCMNWRLEMGDNRVTVSGCDRNPEENTWDQ
ncbi:hypothetical protein HDU67_002073, partial [Dinochytrium kinnereticum]